MMSQTSGHNFEVLKGETFKDCSHTDYNEEYLSLSLTD